MQLLSRKTIFSALSVLLALGSLALQQGDIVELEQYLNSRSSASFVGQDNIEFSLPKDTHGEISETKQMPSGNYGVKIKVLDGAQAGQEVWVYYNKKNPGMKLYASADNFTPSNQVTNLDDADAVQTTQDQTAVADNAGPQTDDNGNDAASVAQTAATLNDELKQEEDMRSCVNDLSVVPVAQDPVPDAPSSAVQSPDTQAAPVVVDPTPEPVDPTPVDPTPVNPPPAPVPVADASVAPNDGSQLLDVHNTLALLLKAPLQKVGMGPGLNDGPMPSCLYRNQYVTVLYEYCSGKESSAVALAIYPATGGMLKVYAEGNGPISTQSRANIFDFNLTSYAVKNDAVQTMDFPAFKKYYSAFSAPTALQSSCIASVSSINGNGASCNTPSMQLGSWGADAQAFLTSPTDDWNQVSQLMNNLRQSAHSR